MIQRDKTFTVKDLKELLSYYEDDLPVYKYVNTNFDYYDPEDHVLEDIAVLEKNVYFDMDEREVRVDHKDKHNGERALII